MYSLGGDEMKLTRESLLLLGICAIDLVVTLLLLKKGTAWEGNPLMGFYLRYGVGTFVMMKLTLILLPIFIAEGSRQYRPRFVRVMLRATIAVYLGTYLLLFVSVNLVPIVADAHSSATHTVQVSEVR
jgi:hypothetical protein